MNSICRLLRNRMKNSSRSVRLRLVRLTAMTIRAAKKSRIPTAPASFNGTVEKEKIPSAA